jgi:hypothetical protein
MFCYTVVTLFFTPTLLKKILIYSYRWTHLGGGPAPRRAGCRLVRPDTTTATDGWLQNRPCPTWGSVSMDVPACTPSSHKDIRYPARRQHQGMRVEDSGRAPCCRPRLESWVSWQSNQAGSQRLGERVCGGGGARRLRRPQERRYTAGR